MTRTFGKFGGVSSRGMASSADDNGSKSSRMGGLKGPAAVIRDVLGEVAHAANLTIKSASLTASMLAGGAASSASSS